TLVSRARCNPDAGAVLSLGTWIVDAWQLSRIADFSRIVGDDLRLRCACLPARVFRKRRLRTHDFSKSGRCCSPAWRSKPFLCLRNAERLAREIGRAHV